MNNISHCSCLLIGLSSEDEEQPDADGTEEQAQQPPVVKRSAWARGGARKTYKGAGSKNKHKGGKTKQTIAIKHDNNKAAATTTASTDKSTATNTKDESDSEGAESENENEKNEVGSDH